jgi:pyruvate dehydrogenase E2 component (dihydrolipoamide acetyltransferase)
LFHIFLAFYGKRLYIIISKRVAEKKFMSTPITMPKQGQSVETCVLLEWMKKKGEQVRQGDILFTYETDKASFEFESPVSGVLLETFFNAQDDVPVHTVVAVVGQPGESIEQFRPGKSARSAAAISSTPPSKKAPAMPAPAAGNIKPVPGTASPRALRKAEKRRSDLSMVEGTGPGGRIIERDVLSLPRFPETAAAGSADGPRDGDIVSEVKLSNMRKIIGTRMQQSLQQSAQLTMHAFADATALVACRKEFKARGTDITITDMVALAAARTLPSHPELNGIYKDDKILRYKHVHLAMAVDTPRGLMVPVVRFADLLSLENLSVKLKELAAQCREGSINPDLLSGGTITISNLGAFGIEIFTPILNPPQVAILGVNTIVPRPVQTENGSCAVRPHIGFSLTIDHRVVDGAPGARFLKALCDSIAAVDTMLPVWG